MAALLEEIDFEDWGGSLGGQQSGQVGRASKASAGSRPAAVDHGGDVAAREAEGRAVALEDGDGALVEAHLRVERLAPNQNHMAFFRGSAELHGELSVALVEQPLAWSGPFG